MNVLINTCSSDFLLVFFDEHRIYEVEIKANLVKKSDYLPKAFTAILLRDKIAVSSIKRIYVVKGYGSFMGARAGVLFAKTLAQVLGAELYTTTYPELNLPPTELLAISYYASNLNRIISTFTKVKDVIEEQAVYEKEPRIG